MDRILRSSGGTAQVTLYDAGGQPATAGGTVTAAVRDSAGAAITGSPFTATNPATGVYQITLPLTLDTLDVYSVRWELPDGSARPTKFEVVGGFLFAIAEVRAYETALQSKTSAEIRQVREYVEERFEEVCRVPFAPRGRRVRLDGSGTDTLILPDLQIQHLVAASIGGVALTAGELAEIWVFRRGKLVRDGGLWPRGIRNVELLYEFGWAQAPEPVRRAGLRYAKTILLPSAMEQSERATAVFTDVGGYRLSTPGRDGPTGLPEVDAVLAAYTHEPAGSFA